MKVIDFITELKRVEKLPTLYKWGTFLNKYNGRYLLSDCSGLIKGVLWGYPDNGKYASNGVLDINANTIISKCKDVSTDFSIISKGEFVWMSGHCGVYIGNGQVIESSPAWENGVQITKLLQRKWKKHGKLPWIDYSTTSSSSTSTSSSSSLDSAITVIAQYVIKGTYGNGHTTRANGIYDDVQNLVNGRSISKTGDLLNALKTVANEVKRGVFKNGHDIRKKTIYELVRDKVNELCN